MRNSVESNQDKLWGEWLEEATQEEVHLAEAFKTGDAEAMPKFQTWLAAEEAKLLESAGSQEDQIRANIDFNLRQARIHALIGEANDEYMMDNLGNALDQANQHGYVDLIAQIEEWYQSA